MYVYNFSNIYLMFKFIIYTEELARKMTTERE